MAIDFQLSSKRVIPFMETARVWAQQSTCSRLSVGAVIFNAKTARLLSLGYNGTIKGMVHCKDLFQTLLGQYSIKKELSKYIEVDFTLTEEVHHPDYVSVTKEYYLQLHHDFSERYEVHAEQNAILNLIKTGTQIDYDNTYLVTTLQPCYTCAKMIAALGIKHIIYDEDYDKNGYDYYDLIESLGLKLWRMSSIL